MGRNDSAKPPHARGRGWADGKPRPSRRGTAPANLARLPRLIGLLYALDALGRERVTIIELARALGLSKQMVVSDLGGVSQMPIREMIARLERRLARLSPRKPAEPQGDGEAT